MTSPPSTASLVVAVAIPLLAILEIRRARHLLLPPLPFHRRLRATVQHRLRRFRPMVRSRL